jgi:hypothetical protein
LEAVASILRIENFCLFRPSAAGASRRFVDASRSGHEACGHRADLGERVLRSLSLRTRFALSSGESASSAALASQPAQKISRLLSKRLNLPTEPAASASLSAAAAGSPHAAEKQSIAGSE